MLQASFEKAQIDRALNEEFTALSHRVRRATEKAGRELLLDPVRNVTREGLRSRKLPTTWRARVYPNEGEDTLSPAFFVSSKAPKIIAAFETGVEITAQKRKFLAIPTVESGRYGRHFLKGSLTPEKWVKENRVALRFQPTRYGGVLIADLQRFRTGKRKGKKTRSVVVARQKPIVVFVLLKKTRLAKRLDIAGVANKAGASYKIAYERAANAS